MLILAWFIQILRKKTTKANISFASILDADIYGLKTGEEPSGRDRAGPLGAPSAEPAPHRLPTSVSRLVLPTEAAAAARMGGSGPDGAACSDDALPRTRRRVAGLADAPLRAHRPDCT